MDTDTDSSVGESQGGELPTENNTFQADEVEPMIPIEAEQSPEPELTHEEVVEVGVKEESLEPVALEETNGTEAQEESLEPVAQEEVIEASAQETPAEPVVTASTDSTETLEPEKKDGHFKNLFSKRCKYEAHQSPFVINIQTIIFNDNFS